ncbi:MAG: hypothetical protein ACJAQZ_003337 [Planctomycetota bacterium]|jgi:hypothetical protein
MKKLVFTALTLSQLLMTSCASLEVNPATGIDTAKSIQITVDCSRPSFEKAIIQWLNEHDIETKLVTESPTEGWHLRCDGSHSWDLAFYLSDAKVTSSHNGIENGSSHYVLSGGPLSLDPDKWHKDSTIVKRLLDGLFGIEAPPTPPKPKKPTKSWKNIRK